MKHRLPSWRTTCSGMLFGIAIAALQHPVWAQNDTAPTLTNLLPAGTVIATEADAPFWWNAIAPIRTNKFVQQGMAQIAMSGFNPDEDFASWAGQTGWALLTSTSPTPAVPSMAVFVQIRDQAAFDKTFAKLTARGAFKPDSGVKTLTHAGVTYYSFGSTNAAAGGPPPMGVAITHGWVLFGIGPNVIGSLIDTTLGTAPGAAAAPAWAQAVKTLPASPSGWLVMDAAGYARNMQTFSQMFGAVPGRKSLPIMDPGPAQETVIAQSFTAQTDGFSSSMVSVPTTDRARTFFTDLAAMNTKPVDGTMLARVPDASGVALYSSGTMMWKYVSGFYGPMMAQDPAAEKQIGNIMLAGTTVAAQYPGPVGMFLTSRLGHGIGFVVEAQAASHDAAIASATQIAGMLTQLHVPIVQSGDTWKLNPTAGPAGGGSLKQMMAMGAMFGEDVNPEIEVDGNYLQFTTSPTWTHATADIKPSLVLPANTGNAFAVGVGNSKWLEPVEAWLGVADTTMSASTPGMPSFVDLVKGFGLENASLQQTSQINADGTTTGSGSITGWDWETGLSKTVDWVSTFASVIGSEHQAQDNDKIPPAPTQAPTKRTVTHKKAPVHKLVHKHKAHH